MGFFSSLFFSEKTEEDQQQKADHKKFDILKYDGIRAQRFGKTEYALKCFIEALKINEDFETMKYLLNACYTLNRHDQALETLNAMVKTGIEPANVLLMRANFLFLLGNPSEAITDCEQAIELEPENYTAYFQLAKMQRALGEPEKAIANIAHLIRLKDDFAEAYSLRADLYLSTGKGNDALADIEKVIELTPEDETAYLLRGRIRELLGDADAAFLDYQTASELNPFNEEAYLLAGQLMTSREKYGEAIALFDEAIEHNENFARAYAARAFAKRQTGDMEGALADEKIAGELNPEEKPNPSENNFDDLYKGNII
jgi:tetratricopeptide (TPR) repeat protein